MLQAGSAMEEYRVTVLLIETNAALCHAPHLDSVAALQCHALTRLHSSSWTHNPRVMRPHMHRLSQLREMQ